MKKICVVTGTRAEYGLLRPLLTKIDQTETMKLILVVTGMHLSPEFGLTYQEIERDGFQITERVEMLLSSDTPTGITKSVGLGVIGFADVCTRNAPDLVLLLGDRYEIYAAAIAAMIHRIPITHIHGGELTQGAIDDAIRHSITKMSSLHFTATEEYRHRVIQMGEEPERVFCVGGLGVENIKNQVLMKKETLEQSINFALDQPYIIVTYHPVTLEDNTAEEQFNNLLCALNEFREYKIIFTKANADTDGRIINKMIDEYANIFPSRVAAFTSMGLVRYLSALRYCEMVVGNSSSGILEAPSFHIPTVNIGDRQLGRVKAESVIDCGNAAADIVKAIHKAIFLKKNGNLENVRNPYEGENTTSKILSTIERYLEQRIPVKKHFYEIDF
ncbi:MAG: UDP-N-acetylglucosamine 2-epimerase (hydrolyzing) [Lachnospiraceae bacterium]